MSGQIPKRWPDMEAWFITTVKAGLTAAGETATVVNLKPAATGAYRQVIVAADPGQLITPISRYVRLRVQVWSVRSNGTTADLADSRDLADLVGFIVESAPRNGNPIVAAEVDAGPSRVKDTESGIEYHASNILLEVHAL